MGFREPSPYVIPSPTGSGTVKNCTPANYSSVLSSAVAGDVLVLADGTYSAPSILSRNMAAKVTIASQNKHGAVFNANPVGAAQWISGSSNWRFYGIRFQGTSSQWICYIGGASNTGTWSHVGPSSNIDFQHCWFNGPSAQAMVIVNNGRADSSTFFLREDCSRDILFEDCLLENGAREAMYMGNDFHENTENPNGGPHWVWGITVRGCTIRNMGSEAIDAKACWESVIEDCDMYECHANEFQGFIAVHYPLGIDSQNTSVYEPYHYDKPVITIRRNRLHNDRRDGSASVGEQNGIWLGTTNNVVENNVIFNLRASAIYSTDRTTFQGTRQNIIRHNTIFNCVTDSTLQNQGRKAIQLHAQAGDARNVPPSHLIYNNLINTTIGTGTTFNGDTLVGNVTNATAADFSGSIAGYPSRCDSGQGSGSAFYPPTNWARTSTVTAPAGTGVDVYLDPRNFASGQSEPGAWEIGAGGGGGGGGSSSPLASTASGAGTANVPTLGGTDITLRVENFIGSFNNGYVNSGTISLPPNIASGRLLIACVTSAAGSPLNVPSGWTQIAGQSVSGGNYPRNMQLWAKVATGTEGSTVAVSFPSGNFAGWSAFVMQVSGADTNLANITTGSFGQGGTTSPLTVPAVTTGYTARLVFRWLGGSGRSTWTPPAGVTLVGSANTTATANCEDRVYTDDDGSLEQLTFAHNQTAVPGNDPNNGALGGLSFVVGAVVTTDYSGTASGSGTSDGSAIATMGTAASASGTSTVNGSAAITMSSDGTASGSATVNGSASPGLTMVAAASGASTVSGSANAVLGTIDSASGTATADGAAVATMQCFVSASGSVTSNGSANVDLAARITPGTATAVGVAHGASALQVTRETWISPTTGEIWTATDSGTDGFDVSTLEPPSSYGVTRYLYLPGAVNNFLSVPHAAGLVFTGSFELRAKARLVGGSTTVLVDKIGSTTGGGYRFLVTSTNQLQVGWSNGAGVAFIATSQTITGLLNTDVWFRVTVNLAAGQATFYTSANGATWTLFEAPAAGGASTMLAGTDVLTLGAYGAGAGALQGILHAAQVWNGIEGSGGTKVFDWSAQDPVAVGKGSFTAASGHTVTVNRASAPSRHALVVDSTNYGVLMTGSTYLQIADHPVWDLEGADRATLLVGVEYQVTPPGDAVLFDTTDANGLNGFRLWWSGGQFRFRLADASSVGATVSVPATGPGRMQVVTVRIGANDVSIRCNGVAGTVVTRASGSVSPSIDGRVGTLAATRDQYFSGLVRTVRWWQKRLADNVVEAIETNLGAS